MKIDSRFLKQALEKGDKPGMPDVNELLYPYG